MILWRLVRMKTTCEDCPAWYFDKGAASAEHDMG